MHYYKFNIGDWNLSTAHLTLEEEAIYFRLINFYYDTESPIPLETQPVLRRLRLGSHSETVGLLLSEFFTETEKGWIHDRCHKDVTEYQKNKKKNKKNGKLGGRPRKQRAVGKPNNNPVGFESEPNTNPSKTLTTNHKPLTTNQGNRGRFTPPDLPEVRAYCLERGNSVDPEKFIDFYQSKNWMVGKNKMKCWKSAVRTWEKSEDEKNRRIDNKQSRTDALKRETFHGDF